MSGNLRKAAALTVVVLVTILLALRFQPDAPRNENREIAASPVTPAEPAPPTPRPRPSPGTVAVIPPDPESLQDVPSHPLAVSFGNNPDQASKEPAILLEILRFYRQEFGTFPPGEDNAQIMHALRGNNPSGLPVMPSIHPRLDPVGRLLDAWGRPFVFHSLSSQRIEIRSLGPDGLIFSADDILLPSHP